MERRGKPFFASLMRKGQKSAKTCDSNINSVIEINVSNPEIPRSKKTGKKSLFSWKSKSYSNLFKIKTKEQSNVAPNEAETTDIFSKKNDTDQAAPGEDGVTEWKNISGIPRTLSKSQDQLTIPKRTSVKKRRPKSMQVIIANKNTGYEDVDAETTQVVSGNKTTTFDLCQLHDPVDLNQLPDDNKETRVPGNSARKGLWEAKTQTNPSRKVCEDGTGYLATNKCVSDLRTIDYKVCDEIDSLQVRTLAGSPRMRHSALTPTKTTNVTTDSKQYVGIENVQNDPNTKKCTMTARQIGQMRRRGNFQENAPVGVNRCADKRSSQRGMSFQDGLKTQLSDSNRNYQSKNCNDSKVRYDSQVKQTVYTTAELSPIIRSSPYVQSVAQKQPNSSALSEISKSKTSENVDVYQPISNVFKSRDDDRNRTGSSHYSGDLGSFNRSSNVSRDSYGEVQRSMAFQHHPMSFTSTPVPKHSGNSGSGRDYGNQPLVNAYPDVIITQGRVNPDMNQFQNESVSNSSTHDSGMIRSSRSSNTTEDKLPARSHDRYYSHSLPRSASRKTCELKDNPPSADYHRYLSSDSLTSLESEDRLRTKSRSDHNLSRIRERSRSRSRQKTKTMSWQNIPEHGCGKYERSSRYPYRHYEQSTDTDGSVSVPRGHWISPSVRPTHFGQYCSRTDEVQTALSIDSVMKENGRKKQRQPQQRATVNDVSMTTGQRDLHAENNLVSRAVSMAASAAYVPGVALADKLRLAASKGQVDKVKELLASGATFEPDREGRTALHYAALNGYAAVVAVLAKDGCEIDLQDTLGYTALHRAAAQGHLEVIRVLLNEGCLVDRQDEVHGNSALHEAAWNGYSKTLEVLLKHKANVHTVNKAGFTALHLAAQNGHNQSARVLLYAGCNPDKKNNYGDTALHTGARYGHAGVTRILVSARAKINQPNKNGDTALHITAALKRRKISKLLVDSGININIKNKQNETAVDVAKRKEHPEIVLIITSQPKSNKKKSASRKNAEKAEIEQLKAPEKTKEKKEKKGLFFKKRSKSKTKDKEEGGKASSSSEGCPAAPSEISTAIHSVQPPSLQPAHPQHGPMLAPRQQPRPSRSGGSHRPVKGVLGHYIPKPGVQYYRDLAGNVRQGPVGYAPVCTCGPQLKRLEKKMEADRTNLYDHIEASHKTLTGRIDDLDRQTTQQVFAIDKLARERLDAGHRELTEHLNKRVLQERKEIDRDLESQHRALTSDLHEWVDNRVTNPQPPAGGVCNFCHVQAQQNAFDRDDAVYQSFSRGMNPGQPIGGRIYRSKSDETLSVASSHISKRIWKLRNKTLRKENKNQNEARSQKQDKKLKTRNSREPLAEKLKHVTYQELPERQPTGRSPEGDSTGGGNISETSDPYLYGRDGGRTHQQYWACRRNTVNHVMRREFQEAEGQTACPDIQTAHTVRQVVEHSQGSHPCPSLSRVSNPSVHSMGDASETQSPVSYPGSGLQCPPLSPIPTNGHVMVVQAQTYPSPDIIQVHHSKTDSSSNPDSGYSSKIYGFRKPPPQPAPSPASCPASSPGQTDTSLGTTISSIASSAQHESGSSLPFNPANTVLSKWYEEKVREADQKLHDQPGENNNINNLYPVEHVVDFGRATQV